MTEPVRDGAPTARTGPREEVRRATVAARVVEWHGGTRRVAEDRLVAEEPLEIRVDGTPVSVTMRTPGHDAELAAGFLYSEGIIARPDDLASVSVTGGARGHVVEVTLHASAGFRPEHLRRHFFASSSCGICGKATIEAVRARGLRPSPSGFHLDPAVLCALPDALRSAQPVFAQTGGLHAAAVFDATGQVLAAREDVGRHNTVDKLIGWALAEGELPLADCGLIVSGRGGFEILQKAIAAGLPFVASVSAPSSLAVALAREMGTTLVGFLRGQRFLVYAGEERIRRDG